MLNANRIKALLALLNQKLLERNLIGEIGIVGGSAMCLLFHERPSTKDIDAIFEPSSVFRTIAKEIAEEEDLDDDWLNDAVKGFLSVQLKREVFMEMTHLRVWLPSREYLLAMKCLSARWDSSDRDDVLLLIHDLRLKAPTEVFKILQTYYPNNEIAAKTRFFIEEIFQKI